MSKEKDKGAEELLKKLFNEKEYKTIIVGPNGVEKEDPNSDVLTVLNDEEATREEKDEALKKLKEQNKPEVLIGAIQGMKSPDKKAKLISACWETGMDFSNDLIFFVRLACDDDFKIAIEAFTVIENMENLKDPSVLQKAKELLREKAATNPPTVSLLNDLIERLDSIS
jgi:hypothetical protein